MKVRIDKLLCDNLNISRKEAKALLSDAKVKINGVVITKCDEKFEEDSEISVDGRVINCQKHIYVMLNKPKGVVSASDDKKEKTVVDLLPDEFKRKNIFPAGRLDKDTVGFVLMTDDGDFAHRILSPKNHIEKTYIAQIDHDLSDDDIKQFEEGIVLADNTVCLRAKCKMIGEKLAEVKVVEGRYHQVKRMFASLSNRVVELKRVKMGDLELDESLKEGECRLITQDELLMITGNVTN